jgi:hypothetical protein
MIAGVDPAACIPWIAPSRREVHLGLAVLDANNSRVAQALTPARLGVAIGGDLGVLELGKDRIELVPHNPVGRGQLVVLAIDRSGSMYAERPGHRPTMEHVVQALLSQTTVEAFFPPDGGMTSSVLLLTFTDSLTGVDGEALREVEILDDPDAYRVAVDHLLDVPSSTGWTHLYDAIHGVLAEALVGQHISAEVKRSGNPPTVVVLTDGFNNVDAADTCGTNEAGLGKLLSELRTNRTAAAGGASVYTIGFGKPFRPEFNIARLPSRQPSATDLCGDKAAQRIDGVLDRDGIDNVSLSYIADAGGGDVYVGEDPGAVARFIANAGAMMYEWYELRVRLDEKDQQRFRQRLPMQLNIRFPRQLETRLSFFPGPYLDAPSAEPGPDGFARPSTVAQATADLLLGLGATFLMFAMGIGGYHLRRAVIRMAREGRGGDGGR